MLCRNCKIEVPKNAQFCQACGAPVLPRPVDGGIATEPALTMPLQTVVIRCGNCSYEGPGESARSVGAQILAWLCILLAPMITIIYFVATPKYRCPKCKSTFLGIKNDQGVFVGQTGGRRVVVAIVCIIAGVLVVGLLSTLAVVALGSTRLVARDFHRLSDLKQLQAALELYKTEQRSYPPGKGINLGASEHACLNASGWQPAGCPNPYMETVPSDPYKGVYTYTATSKSYLVETVLERGVEGFIPGPIKLNPEGLNQFTVGFGNPSE